jgi:hypothetical protein
MSKLEAFKAAFLPNSRLAKKLAQRVSAALRDIEAARAGADRLNDKLLGETRQSAKGLEKQVMAQVELGTANPGAAWLGMAPLAEQAAQLKAKVAGAAGGDLATPAEHFNRALDAANKAIDDARSGTRDIAKGDAAAALQGRITTLAGKIDTLFDTVRAAGGTVTQAQADEMDGYRDDAVTLRKDVRAAAKLAPTPGTERAVSRAITAGLADAVPAIGARLNDPKKDARGRTAMDDVRARLEVFDDRFAQSTEGNPDAARQNKAMRLAAVAAVTARRAAADVNDPNLEPRIARSLVGAYGPEMTATLAQGEDDDEDAKAAVQLAQALVMDDPVGKLMTGKINPEDAVQRIRDMAAAAGEKPSVMLKLLRQQFEMQIGSYTLSEISRGTKSVEKGFNISEVTGELSVKQVLGMTEVSRTGLRAEQDQKVADRPLFQDGGQGLRFRPTAQQVHTVKDGDTLASLAQTYLGDAALWPALVDANKVVTEPPADPKGKPEGTRHDLTKAGKDDKLPVGAVLIVPGQTSLLDQLAPYVAAWDDGEEEAEPKAARVLVPKDMAPPADTGPTVEELRKQVTDKGGERLPNRPTAEQLRDAASRLQSPRTQDPGYIQAPGLGQAHTLREPLGKEADIADPVARAAAEAEKRHGAINERQYAHLRLLARADAEDAETVLRQEGVPVEEVIARRIAARYGPDRVDDKKAREIAAAAEKWIATVPLTITFTASSLFGDASRNEPAHGTQYISDVVYTRGQTATADVIGRAQPVTGTDGKKQDATMGVTGGKKTGWEKTRGANYMRWRRDKDDREGRHDPLAYEDQQIFGAANPSFAQVKGGADGQFGTNYYGDAHFLLGEQVRNRVAFIVRAPKGPGAAPPVQRRDVKMLIYDMLTGGDKNAQFFDALLNSASVSPKALSISLNWEVHLYGGFDMTKDAAAIYLSDGIDDAVRRRIEAFATTNGLRCENIGAKPDGLEVLADAPPKEIALPA